MQIVILGLSITSSWGNGHATTYRGLVRGLLSGATTCCSSKGRSVVRLASGSAESSIRAHRAYGSLQELKDKWARDIRDAEFVIVAHMCRKAYLSASG